MSGKSYICQGMALGDNWSSIILTFNEGAELVVRRVALPERPFRNGKYKGNVIESVSVTVTNDLYGPVLVAQVMAVRQFRTELENLTRAILKSPVGMMERVGKLRHLCVKFRHEVGEDALVAFACWQSVVRMMNSFADGDGSDDTIHPDREAEETQARTSAAGKLAHAARPGRPAKKKTMED